MRTLSALCLIVLFTLGTAACGQKGDLYFPNESDQRAGTGADQQ